MEDRSDDTERLKVYLLLRPGVQRAMAGFTLAVIERNGLTEVEIDYAERDVQTNEPLRRLAVIATDLPRPLGAEPESYQVTVSDLSVTHEAAWLIPEVEPDAVAQDVAAQLPVPGFALISSPTFDGSNDYSLDMACAGTTWCQVRTLFQQGYGEPYPSTLVWTSSYPLAS